GYYSGYIDISSNGGSGSVFVDITIGVPPNIPSNPNPANNSEGVSTDGIKLSWTGGDPDGDVVTYDVYVNLAPEPHKLPRYNEELLINTESPLIYLVPGECYYWKVIATDSTGKKTEGPTWTFYTKTLDQCNPVENSAPQKPDTPDIYYIPPLQLGETCVFGTRAYDPDGDNINIYWDFNGDGIFDDETKNVTSGEYCFVFYKWDDYPPGIYNVRALASDFYYNLSEASDPLIIQVLNAPGNLPPNNATIASGVDIGYIQQLYTFTSYSTDPEGFGIYYRWDFGDGTITDWIGPVDSGTTVSYSHYWNVPGHYDVKVQVKDVGGVTSEWSTPKGVDIVAKKTATIFNKDDFCGATYGDEFNLLLGTGRLGYANGSTGAIVTGAYAGFPAGSARSESAQGIQFYVGRDKTLTITAEIDYVGATPYVFPGAIVSLDKIIRIDGWYNPKIEFTEGISNIGTVEDLKAFAVGLIALAAKTAKDFRVHEMIENIVKTQEVMKSFFETSEINMAYQEKVLALFDNKVIAGEEAVEGFKAFWRGVSTEYGGHLFKIGGTSTTAGSSYAVEVASQPLSAAAAIWLIVTIAWEILTLYQIMTHWQIDTLLEEFKNSDIVHTTTYTKTCNFAPGDHQVWAGIQSNAKAAAIFFGAAYAAGMVKSITIDGISPPEKPTLVYPSTNKAKVPVEFKLRAIDQNQDPVKFDIYWGDGTHDETILYPSGTEVKFPHTYQKPGDYTITLRTIDCDKMSSQEVTYKITIINNGGGSSTSEYLYPYSTSSPSSSSSSSSGAASTSQSTTTMTQQSATTTGTTGQDNIIQRTPLYQILWQQILACDNKTDDITIQSTAVSDITVPIISKSTS
ncbi:MAG: PKD domain-containing protein, partial [Thermoplasmatota archaeon]